VNDHISAPAVDGERHVVIAPDKFKGSLTATQVATQLASGLRQVVPGLEVRLAPTADGGEGTIDAALASGFRGVVKEVVGPLGDQVEAMLAIRGRTGVVEMAQASGLELVPKEHRLPLAATSFGTGELIRAALDAGCREIVLGIGGSAGTDGGAGMVQALGARLVDQAGETLHPGGGDLSRLHQIDLDGLDPRIPETTFVIATDVDNPLLGSQGAAAVFGPQKGATPDQVDQLELALSCWSAIVGQTLGNDFAGQPGAGAAGGLGFGAMAFLGATARPGIELMLEMTGFADLLPGARLVITGEGSLDQQSLGGKTPIGVARAAAAGGVPTIAVAGRTTLPAAVLSQAGFAATYTLQDLQPDLARCMVEAAPLLHSIGQKIAEDWFVRAAQTG
jgi:glycerate kinase